MNAVRRLIVGAVSFWVSIIQKSTASGLENQVGDKLQHDRVLEPSCSTVTYLASLAAGNAETRSGRDSHGKRFHLLVNVNAEPLYHEIRRLGPYQCPSDRRS